MCEVYSSTTGFSHPDTRQRYAVSTSLVTPFPYRADVVRTLTPSFSSSFSGYTFNPLRSVSSHMLSAITMGMPISASSTVSSRLRERSEASTTLTIRSTSWSIRKRKVTCSASSPGFSEYTPGRSMRWKILPRATMSLRLISTEVPEKLEAATFRSASTLKRVLFPELG